MLGILLALVFLEGALWKPTHSRDEMEAWWEDNLRREQYGSVAGISDNWVEVRDNEGYLWGFFGLSDWGGWEIRGRLDGEVPTQGNLLELYALSVTRWEPGFDWLLLEPRYDIDQYPLWQVRLIVRNLAHREQVRAIKTVPIPAREALQHWQSTFKPEDPPCPVGYWCPRGELSYDAARRIAVIKILGVLTSVTVEVPIDDKVMRWDKNS
ncbi:MAG: hypothetical protein OEY77_01410 [Nitrospira sp.]|nr:hypothetical protein [Nitrospira sp.]